MGRRTMKQPIIIEKLKVWLLKATNSADFNEPEYIGTGISEKAVGNWFRNILGKKWNEMLDEDKEFYENDFDTYENSWNVSVWPFNLAQ